MQQNLWFSISCSEMIKHSSWKKPKTWRHQNKSLWNWKLVFNQIMKPEVFNKFKYLIAFWNVQQLFFFISEWIVSFHWNSLTFFAQSATHKTNFYSTEIEACGQASYINLFLSLMNMNIYLLLGSFWLDFKAARCWLIGYLDWSDLPSWVALWHQQLQGMQLHLVILPS